MLVLATQRQAVSPNCVATSRIALQSSGVPRHWDVYSYIRGSMSVHAIYFFPEYHAVPREDVRVIHPARRVNEKDLFVTESMPSSDDICVSIRIVVRVWTVGLRPSPRSEYEDRLRSVHATDASHKLQIRLREARFGHVPRRIIRPNFCGQIAVRSLSSGGRTRCE